MAVKSKKKFMKNFGDDSRKNYEVAVEKNRYIGDSLGVYNILVGNLAENAHYDVNAHAEKGTFDTEKGIIVGNIRMGFGHYRISMAMASAAKSMCYTSYWIYLNSYWETTCTKVIGAQNDLYSLGSRLSKNPIFNKLVWEPMNYEGFRALSYNAADQKNAELMAPVYRNVPKDIPVIGTHVWPAQADLYIDSGYKIQPGSAYQNVDPTSALLAAYQKQQVSGDSLTAAAEAVGVDVRYLKGVVSGELSQNDSGEYNGVMT